MGKDGSRAYYKDMKVEVPAFIQEKPLKLQAQVILFVDVCFMGFVSMGWTI